VPCSKSYGVDLGRQLRNSLELPAPPTKILQNFLKEDAGTFRISNGPRALVRRLFGCIGLVVTAERFLQDGLWWCGV